MTYGKEEKEKETSQEVYLSNLRREIASGLSYKQWRMSNVLRRRTRKQCYNYRNVLMEEDTLDLPTSDGPLEAIHLLGMPGRERGCTIEQFKNALLFVKGKYSIEHKPW